MSAALMEAPKATAQPQAPAKRGSGARKIALAGVIVYGVGMMAAMIGTAVLQGDWKLSLVILPQMLCAGLFGGGAMGAALLAPDPYVKSH